MEVYRLKYKDAEGATSDREIEINGIFKGDNLSSSYIYAFCHSANDYRRFRFDRIKAIYNSDGNKIKDPFNYLVGIHKIFEPADEPEYDSAEPKSEYKPPEKIIIDISQINDIPTLKKKLRNVYITSAILLFLGIISLSTVILPILFFGGAIAVSLGRFNIKKRIKELKSQEVK